MAPPSCSTRIWKHATLIAIRSSIFRKWYILPRTIKVASYRPFAFTWQSVISSLVFLDLKQKIVVFWPLTFLILEMNKHLITRTTTSVRPLSVTDRHRKFTSLRRSEQFNFAALCGFCWLSSWTNLSSVDDWRQNLAAMGSQWGETL